MSQASEPCNALQNQQRDVEKSKGEKQKDYDIYIQTWYRYKYNIWLNVGIVIQRRIEQTTKHYLHQLFFFLVSFAKLLPPPFSTNLHNPTGQACMNVDGSFVGSVNLERAGIGFHSSMSVSAVFWPGVFWKLLKTGGEVHFQGVCRDKSKSEICFTKEEFDRTLITELAFMKQVGLK